MLDMKTIKNEEDFPKNISKDKFLDFLYEHLEKYGDKKEDIQKAIDYAFSDEKGKGGFLLAALQDEELIGGVVINNTGMSGYIPEHILVYIATHKDFRGQGIGTKVMEKIIQECPGDIALHVEYDNPANFLYEKVGMNSKYKEMRYKQRDA